MSMNRYADSRPHFDRRHGPATSAAGDGLEGNYSAVLRTAPSGGTVQVIVPALGLTSWRTAICSQAFTGSPGDRVLVAFDEQKQPWVLSPSGVVIPTLLEVGIARGTGSATFPTSQFSGLVTVTHGLAGTPVSAGAWSTQGAGISYTTTNLTGTTFQVQGAYITTGLSGTFSFCWIASL
jgi:hypothetical protein